VRRPLFVRAALPALALVAATAAVLLGRTGLRHPAEPARAGAAAKAPAVRPLPAPAYHRVRSGDTLTGIALRFDTTVDRLLALNPGIDPPALAPGRKLRVR
jgi:Tfp pilus assembly protein FimV